MHKKIPEQEIVINCDDNCFLVIARPGRGKTSVALWYAERLLSDGTLKPYQKVLFLTFSRNAVYQISTASGLLLPDPARQRLHVSTYHSFMWWLLQNYGRFAGLPNKLDLVWDTKARAVIYGNDCNAQDPCRLLAREIGAITYDCFAPLSIQLLRSQAIRGLLSQAYPVIVVDEFQDTDDEQWHFIKLLTGNSRLCCLADPDQMIHRFRGATDSRIDNLIEEKGATEYPLQKACLRTNEHNLLDFAEAILDNNPTLNKVSDWKQRFMLDYHGPNARSYYLKLTLGKFNDDFKRRGLSGYPSVAIAAYANKTSNEIRKELSKDTGKISTRYSCRVLEPDHDESIEDLVIHVAMWIACRSEDDLRLAIQIIGSLMAPKRIEQATAPTKSLLNPYPLLSGSQVPRHNAKVVIDALVGSICTADQCDEVVKEAGTVIRKLNSISSFRETLERENFEERLGKLVDKASSCATGCVTDRLIDLKSKVNGERLQRCIIERIVPIKGIVATTMHKLKGKEFDYVMLLAMRDEKFYSTTESEIDARRLLYVALTRARYDARILYMGSAPPPLLLPYI